MNTTEKCECIKCKNYGTIYAAFVCFNVVLSNLLLWQRWDGLLSSATKCNEPSSF